MEENITNFEIASSPEELQASMDREAQGQTEAPVQEGVQEQVAEPVQDTPYVDPAPAEPQVQAEQTQETQEVEGEDVETAVLNYLSERLGREIVRLRFFVSASNHSSWRESWSHL